MEKFKILEFSENGFQQNYIFNVGGVQNMIK